MEGEGPLGARWRPKVFPASKMDSRRWFALRKRWPIPGAFVGRFHAFIVVGGALKLFRSTEKEVCQ